MKHQVLNRLSRLFTSSSTATSTVTFQEPIEYNSSTVKQKCSGTQKKSRWSTLGLGKKTKRNSIPVGEWFTSPMENDKNRDSVISSTPVHVGCYYDEKVEIIVPSASMNSFLTTTSTNSGFQHAPFYFSSPCLSPQQEVDEQLHTPRTSIDDQESQKKLCTQTVGLATMVNHILSDAFVVADHDIFDKDDFYD